VQVKQEGILQEGKNCWRIARASRVSFLIDADSYYTAFVEAVKRAQRSVLIVGWDIDSRVRLMRGEKAMDSPNRLGDFLNSVVSRNKNLQAYVLTWDFSLIFALEREPLPVLKMGWRTHRRLHFQLDGKHPIGASHHQKIVVVDDAMAFVGGIDLARFRWDTSRHKTNDPRRILKTGQPYRPFHDVQMAVDAEAALTLGELIRDRWRRATGNSIEPPGAGAGDVWPRYLTADLEDAQVAIARTQAAYNGNLEVREVEALYRDALNSARKYIYIENQYLTSKLIVDLVAGRLQEENGPEVLIVLPKKSSGWLEETTMDSLRAHVLEQLQRADRFGRLKIYYPHLPGLGNDCMNLHSKVLIVDNGLLRIGSSNMSNRSMGLDTECDLAIEAKGDRRIEEAIERLRNRLLGEHLDVSPDTIAAATREKDSLLQAVDSLLTSERSLRPLEFEAPQYLQNLVQSSIFIDPECPTDPEQLIGQYVPEEVRNSGNFRLLASAALLLALFALAAAWQWTPLKDWLSLDVMTKLAVSVREHPLAPLIVISAYVVGGLVSFPATILIIATAITFGPFTGFIYTLVGCVTSAICTYGIGHLLGGEVLRRFAGRRINRLSRQLADRGVVTIMIIRLAPVAPFTFVNLIAGASHIKFWDFTIGTIIGMAPGIFAITLFGNRLEHAIRHPGAGSIALLGAFIILIIGANLIFRRWISKRNDAEAVDGETAN
jgi:phospholipase D1/2